MSNFSTAYKITPRIYVGTYKKYNNGSLAGAWFDLEEYSDKETFYEALAEFHDDEVDPEFMFQDFQGFPRGMVGESFIKEDAWLWLDLDDEEKEMYGAFMWLGLGCDDFETDIESCKEQYAGREGSELDFTYQIVEDTGMLANMPKELVYYFDYEAYCRDLFISGYVRDDDTGYVFSH
jgi:antirestriction protein